MQLSVFGKGVGALFEFCGVFVVTAVSVDVGGGEAEGVFVSDVLGGGDKGVQFAPGVGGGVQRGVSVDVGGVGVAEGEGGLDDFGGFAACGVMQEGVALVVGHRGVGVGEKFEIDVGVLGVGFLCGDHERGSAVLVLVAGVGEGKQGFDGV